MAGRTRVVYEYGARCILHTCRAVRFELTLLSSPTQYNVLRLAFSSVNVHLWGWTSCLLSAACCFGPVTELEVSGWIPHGSLSVKDSLSWRHVERLSGCFDRAVH